MQAALQKAHEMVANLSSDAYKTYLSEMAARGSSAITDVASRTFKTTAYDIVLPKYIDIERELKQLQQDRRDMLMEYIHISNRLVFEDKNDVNLQESYAVIANRLTGIQHKIVTIERYLELVNEASSKEIVVFAMESLPYMEAKKRAQTKKKPLVKKGEKPMRGGASVPMQLIDRVKLLLKGKFGEKIEPI